MRNFLKKGWLLLAIVVVLIAMYATSAYNGFVAQDEEVKRSFSELQATYQRRLDLLPNLVSVVKANSEYEKTVLEQVAQARALALQVTQSALPQGSDMAELEAKQSELAIAANRLIAVIENYPDIKATQAFSDLQTQIEGTERRIKIARQDFNAAVMAYNQEVRKFPASLFAGILGFTKQEGFTADAGAQQAPEIKF